MTLTLYGMAWLLTALGTLAIAFVGGLVQLLVMVARAPAGQRGPWIYAAIPGPFAAAAMGAIAALTVDEFDADTKATLDAAWFMLPLLAFGAWTALTWFLVGGLPKPDAG